MKTRKLIIALLLFVTSATYAQEIDKKASIVNFEVSNMKVRTVAGSFTGMEGEISFNADNLSESFFKVCIDAASVNTANEKRDDHLRNEDFFHVDVFPQICFVSNNIVKTPEGYTTKGKLKMHGVEREESIDFTFDGKNFIGTMEVSRLDYKVGEDTNTGMVGEMIKLQLVCILK